MNSCDIPLISSAERSNTMRNSVSGSAKRDERRIARLQPIPKTVIPNPLAFRL